jgi:hypothetical protein
VRNERRRRVAVIRVERAVDDRCPDLKHQVRAAWRPAHLLLRPHPAMQQPLHGALCWRPEGTANFLINRRMNKLQQMR